MHLKPPDHPAQVVGGALETLFQGPEQVAVGEHQGLAHVQPGQVRLLADLDQVAVIGEFFAPVALGEGLRRIAEIADAFHQEEPLIVNGGHHLAFDASVDLAEFLGQPLERAFDLQPPSGGLVHLFEQGPETSQPRLQRLYLAVQGGSRTQLLHDAEQFFPLPQHLSGNRLVFVQRGRRHHAHRAVHQGGALAGDFHGPAQVGDALHGQARLVVDDLVQEVVGNETGDAHQRHAAEQPQVDLRADTDPPLQCPHVLLRARSGGLAACHRFAHRLAILSTGRTRPLPSMTVR